MLILRCSFVPHDQNIKIINIYFYDVVTLVLYYSTVMKGFLSFNVCKRMRHASQSDRCGGKQNHQYAVIMLPYFQELSNFLVRKEKMSRRKAQLVHKKTTSYIGFPCLNCLMMLKNCLLALREWCYVDPENTAGSNCSKCELDSKSM